MKNKFSPRMRIEEKEEKRKTKSDVVDIDNFFFFIVFSHRLNTFFIWQQVTLAICRSYVMTKVLIFCSVSVVNHSSINKQSVLMFLRRGKVFLTGKSLLNKQLCARLSRNDISSDFLVSTSLKMKMKMKRNLCRFFFLSFKSKSFHRDNSIQG